MSVLYVLSVHSTLCVQQVLINVYENLNFYQFDAKSKRRKINNDEEHDACWPIDGFSTIIQWF